jgi:UDP-GlcNAc:undecaprenyl-phosphate GlcNAc-1-phosphate transferase
MVNLWVGVAAAFAITLVLIHHLVPVSGKIGLVDAPGGRKRHEGSIPLVGGPAIFGGLAFGALLTVESLFQYRALFAGLAIMLVAGVLDDLKDVSPRRKLMAQLIAALCMTIWGGVSVLSLGNLFGTGVIHLDGWSIPFTVICVLGVINAINMADGVDGLAGGLSLVSLVFLGASSLMAGHTVLFQLIAVAIAVVLAFWSMNMNFPWQTHAKIFMGDSGSMILGFLLTWICVETSRPGSGIPAIVPVWFLAVPLLDMGLVILRRLLKGRSPCLAGRDHLHHILLVAGYRPATVVHISMGFAILLGSAAMLTWRLRLPDWVLFYGFLVLLGVGYLISRRAWRIVRVLRRWQQRQ